MRVGPVLSIIVLLGSCFQARVALGQDLEGIKVRRVLFQSPVPVEEAKLMGLLTIREGEPYSRDRVRSSIVALFETGRFYDVQAAPRLEDGEVILTFILKPLFYIGHVKVAGVGKHFKQPQIVNATNLRIGEIYRDGMMDGAISGLKNFLARNGFFKAQIAYDLRYDVQDRLVEIIINVNAGERARLGSINIQGVKGEDAKDLIRLAKLKVGGEFRPQALERAVQRLRNYYFQRGYPMSHVRISDQTFDPEANVVNLELAVETGPRVEVAVRGAKISGDQLRQLIPIFEERSFDQDLIEEGRRRLVDYFQRKGYFDVAVRAQSPEQTDGGAAQVNYLVELGRKHRVVEIEFSGNEHIDDQTLRDALQVREGGLLSRGLFSEDLLKRSAAALQDLYRRYGFERAEIKPEAIDQDGSIHIRFVIREGPQTRVSSLEIRGNSQVSASELLNHIGLKAGSPYSEEELISDRDRILAFYYDRGFPHARLDASVERDQQSNTVKVYYSVHEGDRILIKDVLVRGAERTDARFLLDQIEVKPEGPLSEGQLLKSQSELYSLGIFDRVEIVPLRPLIRDDEYPLLINVIESQPNAITYGFGFEADRRPREVEELEKRLPGTIGRIDNRTFLSPRGVFEISRRNINGRARTATFGIRAARLQKRGLITFTDPSFLGLDVDSLFSFYAEESNEIRTFTARRLDASFQVETHVDPYSTLLFRYSYRRVRLSDVRIAEELIPPRSRGVRLSTISTTFVRDTRDHPLDATSGTFYTLDFGVTPRFIGAQSSFIRFLGQAAYYRQPIKSIPIVFANSLRLGLAKPFGPCPGRGPCPDVPLSERFFAGGATTLRGFPTNEAGPRQLVPGTSDIFVPVGGNALVILNSEMRLPLPHKNLGMVLFYDGGNIFPRIRDISFRNYTNTIGVGFRYRTPIGPARFDIGYNLNPVPGLSRLQFFISLGQAF